MSRRKVGQRTEVKIDFANYSYLLNGTAGIGKTTLACEVGKKLYGENGVMLLTIGQEPQPEHLGGFLADRAKDWADLDLMINDLIEFKDEDYPELRIIAIDTVDELFRLAEQEIIDMYNATVTPNERVGSIKMAYKGYQAGENKVVDLVTNTIFKLRDAGYSIFFIGHTKQKNKKDLVSDIEFEQITSNLEAKYYNAIKDKVNIVACGYIEREMNDIETVKDAFSKKNKQVGRVASEKRVIVFRDEEYAIDVKSHFENIAPKIDFDVDIFIQSILDAIKSQREKFHGKESATELEDLKSKQAEKAREEIKTKPEISDDIDFDEVDEVKNKELKKQITEYYKKANDEDKTKVKEILAKYDSTKLDTKLPTKAFEDILEIFE